MSKSFCSGCKHWVYIQPSENNGKGFHYCDICNKWELKWRKLWCNGKAKEIREAMTREEAIKAIKAWDFLDNDEKETIETLIPELRESDDESIKNAIINHLTIMWGNSQDDICGVNVEDAIAWLEKQSKSKWSEEDEELLQHCCGAVAAADYYTLEDKEEMENWLKSIKLKMGERQ